MSASKIWKKKMLLQEKVKVMVLAAAAVTASVDYDTGDLWSRLCSREYVGNRRWIQVWLNHHSTVQLESRVSSFIIIMHLSKFSLVAILNKLLGSLYCILSSYIPR